MSQRQMHTHLFSRHDRSWRQNHFVYPVISRRSHGLSLGVNVNPGKGCTFQCVYCCVDRSIAPVRRAVDLDRLGRELDELLQLSLSGELYRDPPFDSTPPALRRLNDVAFSGDGEPTLYTQLPEAIRIAADLLRKHHQPQAKIVLITNATELHRPSAQEALSLLDQHHGEVWAKLDAGTDEYRKQVDGGRVTLEHIVKNITEAAQARPLVIQSMFLRLAGEAPALSEIEAYLGQLRAIAAAGGRLQLVQVYTVARSTAVARAAPLDNAILDAITAKIQALGLKAEAFYGAAADR